MKVKDLIRELQTFVVKYPDAAHFPVITHDVNHCIVHNCPWKSDGRC
jgi:hypothetical protein